jgi:hypothetical protein
LRESSHLRCLVISTLFMRNSNYWSHQDIYPHQFQNSSRN